MKALLVSILAAVFAFGAIGTVGVQEADAHTKWQKPGTYKVKSWGKRGKIRPGLYKCKDMKSNRFHYAYYSVRTGPTRGARIIENDIAYGRGAAVWFRVKAGQWVEFHGCRAKRVHRHRA